MCTRGCWICGGCECAHTCAVVCHHRHWRPLSRPQGVPDPRKWKKPNPSPRRPVPTVSVRSEPEVNFLVDRPGRWEGGRLTVPVTPISLNVDRTRLSGTRRNVSGPSLLRSRSLTFELRSHPSSRPDPGGTLDVNHLPSRKRSSSTPVYPSRLLTLTSKTRPLLRGTIGDSYSS